MPILYEYECPVCGSRRDIMVSLRDIEDGHRELCTECKDSYMVRLCGNSGGFRLGTRGRVGWASDGYSTTFGDSENFKAGRKIY